MADDDPTSSLPASQYAQVLAGITPNRACEVDSEESDGFDEFSTPLGTQTEAEIGCVAGTSTEKKKKANLSKVLFINGATTNGEGSQKTSASESAQKTAKGPLLQPEVFRSPERKKIARVNERRFEQGYDSDGDIGPFYDAIDSEWGQDYDDDEEIPEGCDDLTFKNADVLTENAVAPTANADAPSNPPVNPSVATAENSNIPETNAVAPIVGPTPKVLTLEMIDGLNVNDLKKQCKKKGLKVAGKKQDLVERLRKAVRNKIPDKTPEGKSKQLIKKKVNDEDDEVDEVKGFAPGAYWKTLTQNPIAVPEPENPEFKNARAPTVPEDEAHIAAPIKYHYDERFDRPVFKGKLKETVMLRNGRAKKTPDGKDQSREIPYEKGRPDPHFVKKQKLTCDAHPSVFFDIFVPFKTNEYNRAGRGEFPSIAAWTKYTNSKAMIANAGPGGQVYPDFRPFTMREIRQHLGLWRGPALGGTQSNKSSLTYF
jgi:hypothetical protein